ncbi:MAG: HU family DNA-binding protein [Rubellimicrobium sp.]|nr:HU family DNA-binding protein [Rubellimicrobium sp.]
MKSTSRTSPAGDAPPDTPSKADPPPPAPEGIDDTGNGDGDLPHVPHRAVLKKKDFLDRVVLRAAIKRNDARAAAEATLAVLAEAIESGQGVVLPPLGKIRIIKEKSGRAGRQFLLRLSLASPEDKGDEGVAQDDQ